MGRKKKKQNIEDNDKKMDHNQIHQRYLDFYRYFKKYNDNERRDFEFIDYVVSATEVIDKQADDDMDRVFNIFIDRLAKYHQTLLLNEEKEYYEVCSKITYLIKGEISLATNTLQHYYNESKYIKFHLLEVKRKFEDTVDLARQHNYDYHKALKKKLEE